MDIASTLTLDEIPPKLRCAICNKLNVNAFKLPCCDQSICESCQETLSETCPVCSHNPVNAEDCKPNRSLRQTIKVFLKTKEKEKNKGAAPVKPSAPATPAPVEATIVQSIEEVPAQEVPAPAEDAVAAVTEDGLKLRAEQPSAADETRTEDARADVTAAAPSLEKEDQENDNDNDNQSESATSSVDIITEAKPDTTGNGYNNADGTVDTQGGSQSGWANDTSQAGGQIFGGGFDPSQAGFPGMDWSANSAFNPMMQMQMQNGMAGMPNNWNNFNMMGMPHMMDPMSMAQGMFGSFGGPGMGMNGMNMGMGFGGGFGGYSGNQMSGNDFGAYAGYNPGGGYNQQSHQQGNFAQNFHGQNNYQNRFRGRGGYNQRGYGRGNYANGHQNYNQQYAGMNAAQGFNAGQVPTGPKSASGEGAYQQQPSDSAEETRPSQQPSHEQTSPQEEVNNSEDTKAGEAANGDDTNGYAEATNTVQEGTSSHAADTNENRPLAQDGSDASGPDGMQVENFDGSNGVQQQLEQNGESFEHQTMNSQNMILTPNGPVVAPMGAPTGPGMMNDFVPSGPRGGFGRGRGFRGAYAGRGRGGYIPSPGYNPDPMISSDVTVLTAPQEPIGQGVQGAPTGPKAMREGRPNTGFASRGGLQSSSSRELASSSVKDRSPTPERPRSRSRTPVDSHSGSHSRSTSHRRHRHKERHYDDETDTESRERRRERRHHRRSSRKYDDEANEEYDDREEPRDPRSRSDSVDSSRRRKRDKDKHRSSRSHRDRSKEHRRRRHRSRSPGADDVEEDDRAEVPNGDEYTDESASRRKSKSEKYRDRDDDYERERRKRDREREHRGREKDKERKDRDRKRSHRDRSATADYEEDERHHRSSRHSRKDRHRGESRESDRKGGAEVMIPTGPRADKADAIPPPDAPKGPSGAKRTKDESKEADIVEFKIAGRSRDKARQPSIIDTSMPPPTGPRSSASKEPPKGPSADRSRRQPSTPVTPTTPLTTSQSAPSVSADPYAQEREAQQAARLAREQQRRKQEERRLSGADSSKPFAPPSGPSADRGKKRRRGSVAEDGGGGLESRITGASEGGRSRKGRRTSYAYEDQENDEMRARRVEVERESERYR